MLAMITYLLDWLKGVGIGQDVPEPAPGNMLIPFCVYCCGLCRICVNASKAGSDTLRVSFAWVWKPYYVVLAIHLGCTGKLFIACSEHTPTTYELCLVVCGDVFSCVRHIAGCVAPGDHPTRA